MAEIEKEEEGACSSGAILSSQEVPEEETEAADPPLVNQQRFCFESDILALKNNPDYCKLLKTLATLEAQKVQAIQDLEVLLQAQAKAEKDPLGFVEALRNGTFEPLPTHQKVAELPEINWKGYIDSLQKVAKQRSTIYMHTRKQATKPHESWKLDFNKTKEPAKEVEKPPTYRQPWTPEEQARFEELLRIHPPEAIERRRFEKIATALGTRTTQQVASHVQKYFIKLANAGLPVPGRTPNVAKFSRSRKPGRSKRLNKPSTFFSSLTPHVYMTDEGSTAGNSWESTIDEDSSDEDSGLSELALAETSLTGSEGFSTSVQAAKCVNCGSAAVEGYWQCSECPEDTPTQLCTTCVNSNYRGGCHSPSHDMRLLSSPHGCYTDKDYTQFTPHTTHTDYNYLDPNFYPAS